MPSQQVINKLESLQLELEILSEAVKHIDNAAKVAETSSEVLGQIPKLLSELKAIEVSHHRELEKLHKEKVDEVSKLLWLLHSELKYEAQQLSKVIAGTKNVENAISNYFTEIKKINFPERLDKIDNQISSINIGVGNLQASIQRSQEKIEKGFEDTNQNLRSGFSSINDNIKHSQEKVTSDLASHTNAKTAEITKHLTEQNQLLKKEVKTNRIIQIVELAIILIILIYVAVKH